MLSKTFFPSISRKNGTAARKGPLSGCIDSWKNRPYAEGKQKQMIPSVVLSVLSVAAGLVPFYCMYRMLCLFVAGTATAAAVISWCVIALAVYATKILLFALSTGVSHAMSYSILEGLRLRPATVQNADQLLVVAGVQLAEHGTHAELLRQDGSTAAPPKFASRQRAGASTRNKRRAAFSLKQTQKTFEIFADIPYNRITTCGVSA